jgi:hypothetical protein
MSSTLSNSSKQKFTKINLFKISGQKPKSPKLYNSIRKGTKSARGAVK